MKQINFNDKRILKSLLDKTKTVFIEKAFKYVQHPDFEEGKGFEEVDKPCKYKKGEIYEVVWKKYSKHKYFKKSNGEAIPLENFGLGMSEILDDNLFNKNLGKVKITKIEKIEIDINTLWFDTKVGKLPFSKDMYGWNEPCRRISKSIGDKSPEDMFKRIEEMANLSEARPFYLISKEWIK